MKARSLILIAICCFLIPLLAQPMLPVTPSTVMLSSPSKNLITPSEALPPLPGNNPPLPEPDYAGVGMARSVQEAANRTDGSQDVFLFYDSATQTPGTDSASVVLPPGWTGYRLDYSIYDLYENRTWALNPSFNGNANNWAHNSFDAGGANTFPAANNAWIAGGPDGNGYVRVQENGRLSGSYYYYDTNDRTWWQQTFTVNRSDLEWAGVKMDYRIDSAWGSTSLFIVYIRVNGTQVWGTAFTAVGDTSWHNTGFIPINTALFDLPNSAIEIEIGLRAPSNTGYSSNDWMRAEFDNVWLYMKTKVYPSEINLQMNGLEVEDLASRGSGFVRQYPTTVWATSPVLSSLIWAPTPNPPNPDLDIEVTGLCDLNLFANKTSTTLYAQNPTATGVGFYAKSGQNTTWTLYYQLALPSQYWNDVFNFTIPVDWKVTFVSEPQLPTTNKVGQCQGGDLGDGYLIIPATTITNSPDGYWLIQAESHNYVDSVELQIYDGTWNPTSTIRAENTTRVQARILDGLNNPPPGVSSTQANVTIYQPGGGFYYTELVNPTASGWIYTSSFFNDGWNTTGGTYQISVTWDNSTEAGEFRLSYTMEHSTSLTPREPLIEAFLEDQPLFPKVRYEDADSHSWLEPPATVEGNWTTGTISFHYVSGTGYYEAEINAQDPGIVGQFWIRVNASKGFYDDAYCFILIDLVSETDVESPQVGGVEVPWRGNATVAIHYTQKIGGGVTGATVTCNWTVGFYTISEGTDGWYYIELNSTGPGVIGNYLMNVTIYRERYQRQQIRIPVFVTPMTLIVTSTVAEPVNVTYGEDFWVEIYVQNFLFENFNDANVTFSWVGGTAFNTSGVNGLYGYWFQSSTGNIGIHYLTAYVEGPNVIPSVYRILIHVKQIGSILDTVPSGQYSLSYVVGTSFSIPVNYTTIFGDPVQFATVTYYVGALYGTYFEVAPGIYNGTIDTAGLVAGSYTIYITASSPNVASQARAISLILTLIPAALEPETSTYVVYWGLDFTINIYFRNLFNDTPVTGATIEYFWGPYSGNLVANGTPGWYTITLPSTAFSAGSVYTATFAANQPSFQFVVSSATIYIEQRPTQLELVSALMIYPTTGLETWLNISEPWTVPRSDVLYLYFNFTDYTNHIITGAIGAYTWFYGSGTLTFQDGLYVAALNMTEISPANYYLDITLSRQNYETSQILQLPVRVTLVRTEIRGLLTNTNEVTGTVTWYTLTLWDLDHDTSISGSTITVVIPGITDEDGWLLTDNGDGTYTTPSISFPFETTYVMEFRAETGLIYSIATHQTNVNVALHPVVQAAIRLGLVAAIIGILILVTWLAYTRVFAFPWLVRKMRKMSTTLGKGDTPHLSNRDINRIATRPESMEAIIEPAYGAIGVAVATTVLPAAITIEEREAEDEVIWHELEKLEGLGHDQKLELFEEMRRIPTKDRVWFIEDLKAQMADGTRFGRRPTPPTTVPEGVDPLIHARLQSIEALGPKEKEAVIEQLRGLSKEEQEEVIRALEETERKPQ